MINSADDARPASARAASRLEVKSNLSSFSLGLALGLGSWKGWGAVDGGTF